MRKRLKGILTHNAGAATLETAYVLPVILLALFGFVACVRLYWIHTTMESALIGAGRFAMLNAADDTRLRNAFRANTFGLGASEFTFTATTLEDQGIHYKTLTATRSVAFLNFIPFLNRVQLHARVTIPPPAGIFPCVQEQALLTAADGYIQRVENDSNRPIRLFWIDRDDSKLFFMRIAPGESQQVLSVENKQPWMVADDSGACLEIVVPWRLTPNLIVSATGAPG